MRTPTICYGLVCLAACAKPEPQVAKDTTAMAPMAAGAPAAISLASIAGKWKMQTMKTTSDSVILVYEINAGADASGWTITFPNRAPLPMRVVASGDSIIGDVGPYESALRKGVQVKTHTVFRLEGADLVGTGVARYSVSGPDSLLNLRMHGTRAP